MDRSSFFIKDKAMFGSFPTQEAVDELESNGVRFFINLTNKFEKRITPYQTRHEYINFPIVDHSIPQDWPAFARFLIRVADIIRDLKAGELVYIHCKGGHGRAGVVVACLLCYIYGMSVENALMCTSQFHSKRSIMRDKWRNLGSPQSIQQKNFVHDFFDPLPFYRAYKTGSTAGFSNFSPHWVDIPKFGRFPTAEAAIQAYKAPDNAEYVKKQKESRSPLISKSLGRKIVIPPNWDDICDDLMFKILRLKFEQHPELKHNLMNTGFRHISQHTHGDNFWGDGGNGKGQNRLGRTLMRLRKYYYLSPK